MATVTSGSLSRILETFVFHHREREGTGSEKREERERRGRGDRQEKMDLDKWLEKNFAENSPQESGDSKKQPMPDEALTIASEDLTIICPMRVNSYLLTTHNRKAPVVHTRLLSKNSRGRIYLRFNFSCIPAMKV